MITRIISGLLLVFFHQLSLAQNTPAQKEINKDVWLPFMQAYNNLDAEKFNALHTEDVLRITDGGIRRGEEYLKSNLENFSQNKQRGTTRTIEFSFLNRHASDNIAFEEGYYKVLVKRPDQKARYFYGYFHVLLRKGDQTWKIAMDWDTGEINSREISEEDFKAGSPLH